MTRFAPLLGLGSLLVAGCDGRPAAPSTGGTTDPIVLAIAPMPKPKPTYETDVAPALARHCLACHDSATRRGGIALDGDGGAAPGPETWARVADALRSGTMPPKGRPGPSPAERAALDDWLGAEVFRRVVPDADPARVTMRRLNRAEYDNSIRDLLGLQTDLRLADAFPADDVGYGFDNIGDVLSIPPILMEKYLEAANLTIDAAARSSSAWARIMNPAPDAIPPGLRKPTYPARNAPVKRIGRPAAAAPVVEDPEVAILRRGREILRGFADRAYRRPATADELDRLVGLVESARKDGDDLDSAVRHALKAVLIAPGFLFHVEEEAEPGGAGQGRAVGEFELAARLASFLWSSIPDDELYRLAVRGELGRGKNLDEQVRRMLRDGRSRALVDGFAAQWLGTRGLKDVTPDPAQYPDFDEPLRRAMIEEAARFAGSIFREDRDISTFLDADYTFVNERLARHYGIPGVAGDHFRRVSLAGTGRGGVLTMAGVLTVTSNPTRTSPVKRGKWILDNLLGMPPPPPPDGVEGLRAGATAERPATLRQAMERHRADPGCASCHSRMDPLGFGLENFDGIGGWRASEGGEPIDASGTVPGAGSFAGPSGLRDHLKARRDRFVRCLAEKLLTYALGRGLGLADRCAVDAIARQVDRNGGRFSALALAIVESPPFQGLPTPKEDP